MEIFLPVAGDPIISLFSNSLCKKFGNWNFKLVLKTFNGAPVLKSG
jgi:hypothetical protein